MNTIPCIITDYSITLVVKGKPYTVNAGQANFSIVKQRIADGKFDGIEQLFDAGAALGSFTKGNVVVKDNAVFYKGQPVHNYVVERILTFMREGLPYKPLVNFLDKLMQNPSFRAVQELYGFLEATNLPITEDGDFLAFRKVTADYKDFYTGQNDNSVGVTVSMPRNLVNEDKDQTCSYGLHFCSHSYLPHYHGGQGRVVIVKINPANVVAIPSDYNNAKGRCSEYLVYSDCEGHDSGTNFTTPLFRTQPVQAEVVVEVEADEDDTYDSEGQVSYQLGFDEGKDDARNLDARDAEDALNDAQDGTVNDEAFLDGYHAGYDSEGFSNLSTREKLSKIASAAKRDNKGRFA